MSNIYDIFILGGGINGAGIARDAAGRGLKVCLADKGEIGGATSSWSTKLIHGGLRYLENYEFKLVRESYINISMKGLICEQLTKQINLLYGRLAAPTTARPAPPTTSYFTTG